MARSRLEGTQAGTPAAESDDFYENLPVFESFASLADSAVYTPLPDGWVLGLADIVGSTQAIDDGRYKVVNTAAAAVIAAVANALGGRDFPFVFGGDGASFALPPEDAERGREALGATAAFVRDEFDLELRAAFVPMRTVRARGHDVRISRFAPSKDVSYAMFTGGGLAWAEGEMKAGAFAVAPGAPGTRPDLSGLSCRFDEMKSERGVILSLIVMPKPAAAPGTYDALVRTILGLVETGAEAGRPVPAAGPPTRWPPAGFALEARTRRTGRWPLWLDRALLGVRTFLAFLVFRTGLRVGGFDPAVYCRQLVENTDFRKFDDALRMTIDCTPALADRLEELLRRGDEAGTARSGTHRQAAALMTCFVPSPTRGDHVHFVDGAMGGYAAAAQSVKSASTAPVAGSGWQ